METVGTYAAKTHLPKLLARVIKGEADNHYKAWRTSSHFTATISFKKD